LQTSSYSRFRISKTDDEQCVLLAQILKVGSPELTTLDLRGNVLELEGDSALASVLRNMTSVT
jgi:Ran GTPase-activating protein (RanGAP) involved in mRNA processing and transport